MKTQKNAQTLGCEKVFILSLPEIYAETVKKEYGFSILEAIPNSKSYSNRVWNIRTDRGEFLLKNLIDFDCDDLVHHAAEVSFAQSLNERMQGRLQTVRFVETKNNETICRVKGDDYLLLIRSDQIISKTDLSEKEQVSLGQLLAHMHQAMSDFTHSGLGTTNYMRAISRQEQERLPQVFPDRGYEPYMHLLAPLDYHALKLPTQVIHGDWHQSNMSFSKPPLLFDLDTLARGARIEEIARTVTHWWLESSQIKRFYTNLLAGYGILNDHEVSLIP